MGKGKWPSSMYSAQGQMITGKERITVQVATKMLICRSRTKLRWAQPDTLRPRECLASWAGRWLSELLNAMISIPKSPQRHH